MDYVVSVDYLQVFGHCIKFIENENYTFKRLQHSTRHFSELIEVYNWRGELYCTIQRKPFSRVIDLAAMIVKLANSQLYKPYFASDFKVFLLTIGFEFRSFSRLDICCDFLKFKNGLTPQVFMQGFFSNKYLKNGRASYQVQGEQLNAHRFDYLRFGSNESDVSVYLYNKTKELQDVKNKPHIVNKWEVNNLTDRGDVWRLEVSLKSSSLKLLDLESGEVLTLSYELLLSDSTIVSMFRAYVSKYFQFKKNDGLKNKTRMADLVLFSDLETPLRVYNYKPATDTTRADKIFIKKLHLIDDELYTMPSEVRAAQELLRDFYVNEKQMKGFFEMKKNGWEAEKRG